MKIVKLSDDDEQDFAKKSGDNFAKKMPDASSSDSFRGSQKNFAKNQSRVIASVAKQSNNNSQMDCHGDKSHRNDKSENFAKNPAPIREEKFVSYEDFYNENGRDQTNFEARKFSPNSFQNSAKNSFNNSRKTMKISPQKYYEKLKIRREKINKKIREEKIFRENLTNGNLENEEFFITKIVVAAKTAGRYNIFINSDFAFSLDENQLVDLALKKGQKISAETFAKLKNESDFGKNYIAALDLISRRIRSEKEIRDYGFRKKWTRENIEKVVARLREKHYLNDENFAKSFVRSRANLRNFSKRKMEMELMKKGISNEIREKILRENDDFDEQNSLKKLIAKKRKHYESREKLVAYLARQGFNYDDIKSALDEFREE